MKLLIITHAPTINNKGKFSSYAPYVNEMDLWFKFGHSIAILSPGTYSEKILEKKFNFQQIKVFRLPFIRIQTIIEGIKFGVLLPIILIQFLRAFFWADHIHLRCPGNVGLIGCLIQIFFPLKYKTAKYAGNWDPVAKQPLSYRLQKKILSSRLLTRRMTVLVYGEWSGQTKNIKSFFTASFKDSEKIRIEKTYKKPFKFLFVGSLVEGKQPLVAAKIVKNLNEKGITSELHFYGDGILKEHMREFAEDQKYFFLHGNQALEVVKEAYKDAHFVILASKSEGWPKAIAEGMFYGCIPIASRVSCVPWMLGKGSRGILAPPTPEGGASNDEWVEEIVKKVEELIKNPEEMKRMSMEAQEWSQEYTLEKFESEIKKLLFQPDVRP